MIIPLLGNNIKKFKIGDKIILTKEIERSYYMFTQGHELTIVGKNDWGFIFKDEETGIILKRTSIINYTHKVTLKESKKLHKNYNDRNKFMDFIVENCPQKDYTYEDRDKVDICKWREKEKKNNCGWKYCKPCFDCFKFITEDKYKNNSFILNYNRKIKLKKLKNGI